MCINVTRMFFFHCHLIWPVTGSNPVRCLVSQSHSTDQTPHSNCYTQDTTRYISTKPGLSSLMHFAQDSHIWTLSHAHTYSSLNLMHSELSNKKKYISLAILVVEIEASKFGVKFGFENPQICHEIEFISILRVISLISSLKT